MLPQAIMYAKTGAVCLTLAGALSGGRAVAGEKFLDYQQPERTRDAFIQTVVDLRRGVDLLLARSDVDGQRIGYFGGSFGAFVGGVPAGVEKRIRAFALASPPASINDATVETVVKARETMPPEQLRASFAIVDAVAAIHYASHAAPSALLLQNGTHDAGVPRDSAERLHRAASEPKTLRWYEAGHGLNNQAVLDRTEWLRSELSLSPLDAADRKPLESPRL